MKIANRISQRKILWLTTKFLDLQLYAMSDKQSKEPFLDLESRQVKRSHQQIQVLSRNCTMNLTQKNNALYDGRYQFNNRSSILQGEKRVFN